MDGRGTVVESLRKEKACREEDCLLSAMVAPGAEERGIEQLWCVARSGAAPQPELAEVDRWEF
jgi:hypothetical protein